jgi:ArsR family transcriptional regulator, cadmium/lead-responsive transcriptional repressor
MAIDHEASRHSIAARAPLAAIFHSLADPTRLDILDHLRLGEHRVVELTEHLQLAQSTTSAHLAVLKQAGLVTMRTEGRSSLYSLNEAADVTALLAAAKQLSSQIGRQDQLGTHQPDSANARRTHATHLRRIGRT